MIIFNHGKTKPRTSSTGMWLKFLSGLQLISSSTWLSHLSEIFTASRDTMTRRMSTSSYTSLTSPLVNGLSLTKISNARMLDSTRWEECISSIQPAKSSDLTPALKGYFKASLTSKSLFQEEYGLSQTEPLPLQMLGKKELGTLSTVSNTRCFLPMKSQESLWLTMHLFSLTELVLLRVSATNVSLICRQVLTGVSGLSIATRTKMVTLMFSSGILSSEDGTMLQAPRVLRSALITKSRLPFSTPREESMSLPTLALKSKSLTLPTILIPLQSFLIPLPSFLIPLPPLVMSNLKQPIKWEILQSWMQIWNNIFNHFIKMTTPDQFFASELLGTVLMSKFSTNCVIIRGQVFQ